MPTILRAVLAMLVAAASIGLVRQATAQDLRWTSVAIPASGVSLRVPLSIFEAMPVGNGAEGQLFLAKGGEAQLLLGGFRNDDGRSLAKHRRVLLTKNYAGASIDYAPKRKRWFVISGTMDERTFYQRVAFSCSGRLINSWAMIYPTRRKRFYDRLVERMHGSFKSGCGPEGDCRLPALTN